MNTPEYPSFEAAEQACREQGLTPLRNHGDFTVCAGEVLSIETLGPGTYEARAFLARVIPPEPEPFDHGDYEVTGRFES